MSRSSRIGRALAPAIALATGASLLAATPAMASSRPRLVATANALALLPHNELDITGTVSPRGGGIVDLQRFTAGHWVQLSHTTVNGQGHYSFAVRTTATLGTTVYRVLRPASAGTRALTSRTLHVLTTKAFFGVSAATTTVVTAPSPITVTGHLSAKAKGTVRLQALQHGSWHDLATAGVGASATGYRLSVVVPAGSYDLRVRRDSTASIAAGVSGSFHVTVRAAAQGQPTGPTPTTSPAPTRSPAPTTSPAPTRSPAPTTSPVPAPTTTPPTTTTAPTTTAPTTAPTTSPAPPPAAPTVSVSLTGTPSGTGTYTGPVQVTVTVAGGTTPYTSTSYTLDGTTQPYTGPLVVTASGAHTVTATVVDGAGRTATSPTTAWSQSGSTSAGQGVTATSSDQAVLQEPQPRLVFATYRGDTRPMPTKSYTLTNTTSAAVTVSLTLTGTNASDFRFASGQPTTLSLAAGASAPVSIVFVPADPTGCPDTANPTAISPDVDRTATLHWTTTGGTTTPGNATLAGAAACSAGGNSEPVLDQVFSALGYTDTIGSFDRRYIGPQRTPSGDEVIAPSFTQADSSKPVTLTPIAHYGSGNTTQPYQTSGWYAQGATMGANSVCTTSSCHALWQFAPDSTDSSGNTVYNQNQLLLPAIDTNPADTTSMGGLAVAQSTSFTPSGPFGIFSSDFSEVNFSDDALNTAHTGSGVNETASTDTTVEAKYLHQMRIYPAKTADGIIPNTYIVTDDLSRVPGYKNNDYQDVVMVLSNAAPATAQGLQVNGANATDDLTAGGTVNGCQVTGFDGVLAASDHHDTCVPGNLSFGSGGLSMTSTAGQLADGNQDNALYKTFDASRGAFTIDAHITGGLDQVTSNYRQIAAFFGPDDTHFFKVEAEHNGAPGLTLFYKEPGSSRTGTITSAPVDFTTASTLDLIIKGNTSVKAAASDTDPGFPLAELTAWYSIDGAAPVQIGSTIEYPMSVTGFFSRSAKAGILVASPQTTPFTATFGSFAITTG